MSGNHDCFELCQSPVSCIVIGTYIIMFFYESMVYFQEINDYKRMVTQSQKKYKHTQ